MTGNNHYSSSNTKKNDDHHKEDDDDDDDGSYEKVVAPTMMSTGTGTTTVTTTSSSSSTSNSSSSSQSQTNIPAKGTARKLIRSLKLYDFININKPWILVPNGSLVGFFDWVPIYMRIGPWKTTAIIYLGLIQLLTIYSGIYIGMYIMNTINNYDNNKSNDNNTSSVSIAKIATALLFNSNNNSNNNVTSSSSIYDFNYDEQVALYQSEYPQLYSIGWYCNVIGFVWMVYIIYHILFLSFVGPGAWVTYTVQSWTILTLRFLLCSIAPISRIAFIIAEYIKFPCCVSTTITFVIWNFFIAPYVYYIAMKTPIEKLNFYNFCTSFRLLNIHGLNIILLILNVVYTSPCLRQLQWMTDFYPAIISVVLYMTIYLMIFDRLGIHLYPIFSPRSNLFLITWTVSMLLYFGLFFTWRQILVPVPTQ